MEVETDKVYEMYVTVYMALKEYDEDAEGEDVH